MSSYTRRIVPRYLERVNCAVAFRRGASLPFLLSLLLPIQPADAQTFVQLTDLGSSLGPRLTIAVTRARLNRQLFGAIGTKVTFIDHGAVYQFASDPEWSRVLVGRKDEWIHEYDNATSPGGKLLQPLGIEISARKFVYAVDPAKGMILVTEFSPGAKNLVNPDVWSNVQFPRPVDVAWDGSTTPLTVDYLYVLDDSLSRVSYWDRSNLLWPNLLWWYGTPGSGLAQFLRPSGICVGKTVASNGGTQFTTHFYVVDRGNRRVVWLNRGPSALTWMGTISLGTWDPTDCAVDHFGNLYVTDQLSHRIHKFTYALSQLATYGSYGTGAGNLNTFAFPRAISVPCGLKIVNSQTVWYCEGRIITAEDWSETTGAVEHYLGIDGAITAQPQPDAYNHGATFSYSTTDHATHWITVWNQSGATVRRNSPGFMPPGPHTRFWNGYTDAGTSAPTGNYTIGVSLYSAYGCSGQSWCAKGLSFQPFYHQQEPPPPPCDHPPRCPFSPPISDPSGDPEPASLFLRQRVVADPRPLARLTSQQLAAASSAAPRGVSDLVRELGVRGVTFSVTRELSSRPIKISVQSVSGRRIRTLVNEVLAPGVYEVGWDGLDDRGRPAAPGVYFAVLTAGTARLVQRLILR